MCACSRMCGTTKWFPVKTNIVGFLLSVVMLTTNAKNDPKITSKLLDDLLTDYDPRVIPYQDGPPQVDVSLIYPKLVSVDTNQQTLDMIIEIAVTWTDPALSWNSSDYGNFTQFICPRNLIWTPDITIYNAEKLKLTGIADEEKMIRLSSDGSCEFYLSLFTTFICPLDMMRFPFDKQNCEISFLSHTYNSQELTFAAYLTGGYGEIGNGEFSVENLTSFARATDTDGFLRQDVFIFFTLVRSPAFYVAVIIIPTFLLASVCIIGLFGPKPDSDIGPEKVPLSLATLMAMTVLLSIVADYLPRNQIPVIGYYILSEIALCVIAALISVVISFVRSTQFLKRKRSKQSDHRQNSLEKPPTYDAVFYNGSNKDIAFYFCHFYRRIDALLGKSEREIDHRREKEANAVKWSRSAVKINMALVVVFLIANIGLLISILSFWR